MLNVTSMNYNEFLDFVQKKRYLFGVEHEQGPTGVAFKVTFDDAPYSVYAGEVFTFFFEKLLEVVNNDLDIQPQDGYSLLKIAIAVPIFMTEQHVQRLYDSISTLG